MKTTLLFCVVLTVIAARTQAQAPAQPAAAPSTKTNTSKSDILTRWNSARASRPSAASFSSQRAFSIPTNSILGKAKMANKAFARVPANMGNASKQVVTNFVSERGPDHRVINTVVAQTNEAGELIYSTNHYTELATGLHNWQDGQWVESHPEIKPIRGGASTVGVAHNTTFSANLNQSEAVDILTPAGKRLRSHPAAIGYFDRVSGESVFIGEAKDSIGRLLPSGDKVLYSDAFTHLKADVLYTLKKSGLSQDVIFQEQLPSPADYGLDPKSTDIEIWTEFHNPPQPAKRQRMDNVTGQQVDGVLDFGDMRIVQGTAFNADSQNPRCEGILVNKEWITAQGRTFLLESVPYKSVLPNLARLPQRHASANGLRERLQSQPTNGRIPPALKLAKASKPQEMEIASAKFESRGFVVDYEQVGGSYADFTFAGNSTYFISESGFVISGTCTIEGGAVIKASTHGGVNIEGEGNVRCLTGPYNPAIFTSQDDDSVGVHIDGGTGTPSANNGFWALVLWRNADIKYLRIKYAYIGIACFGNTTSISHCQILHCNTDAIANWGYGTLAIRNCLIADIQGTALSGSGSISGENLTINSVNYLEDDDNYPNLVNSILSNVSSLGMGAQGDHNGFYNCQQFGNNPIVETQSPFAPTGFIDPNDNSYHVYLVNAQGAYYLRTGSPFVDAGTTDIDSILKNDLAKMTTTVPDIFVRDDINSSMTLNPQPIRDTDIPDLGYHYPAVDYVLNGATVNNATLNVDQGTVLGFFCPVGFGTEQEWGIRLNPGGRINVNGVPTNHVTFARLEAVQESPIFLWWASTGPLLTHHGIVTPSGTVVMPLAEMHLHYVDFPTVNGGANFAFYPISHDSANFDLISSVELDGCHFQGGNFGYESGGLPGRTFTMKNSIFERSFIQLIDSHDYNGDVEEQLTVANNLFYGCGIEPYPFSGENWTVTDNIFDQSAFWSPARPVPNSHHNAYVGMSDRLYPQNQPATDPSLASLSYQTGPLGNFYLPTSATALIHTGSRTAANAGLYHFTTLTSNTKEATGQVNIGPAYLALDSSIRPVDSNNDGVPDFLADRNGNGIQNTGEIPWNIANNSGIAVLSPAANATVNGIIEVQVNLGTNAPTTLRITPFVDGDTPTDYISVANPAQSSALIQIDTRRLQDGIHTLQVQASDSKMTDTGFFRLPTTVAVPFLTANETSYPSWESIAEEKLFLKMKTSPNSANTLWFYGSDYTISYSSPVVNSASVVAGTDGSIDFNAALSNLGFGSDNTAVYSIAESPTGSGGAKAAINPATDQAVPVASFPTVTKPWVTAYTDDGAEASEYALPATGGGWQPGSEAINTTDNPELVYDRSWIDHAGQKWLHDAQLGAWRFRGGDGSDVWVSDAIQGATRGQTWPMRTFAFEHNSSNKIFRDNDVKLLHSFLEASGGAINFYGRGHGVENLHKGEGADTFMSMSTSELKTDHRFRFVFLDGCRTASPALMKCFNIYPEELANPMPIKQVFSSGGPRQLADYPTEKKPGAFLGYDRYVPFLIFENPATHATVNGHVFHSYDRLCRFHTTIVGT